MKTLVKFFDTVLLSIFLTVLSCSSLSLKSCNPSHVSSVEEKVDYVSFTSDVLKYLKKLTETSHPTNFTSQDMLKNELITQLQAEQLTVYAQSWQEMIPDRESVYPPQKENAVFKTKLAQFHNIVIEIKGESNDTILLGSHYDTKIIPNGDYLGANDSGSSTAFLLAFASRLQKIVNLQKIKKSFLLVLFDGEESVLNDWNEAQQRWGWDKTDHLYGSRYFVSQLQNHHYHGQQASYDIKEAVILDMMGEVNWQVTNDTNSSPRLFKKFADTAFELAHRQEVPFNPFSSTVSMGIEDDHFPFKEAGIEVLDIIDFTNLNHWHQPTDRMENIASINFEIMAKILLKVYAH